MLTFNLNYAQDRDHFVRVIAGFQIHGVEYKLSYDAGFAYVTPFGAKK